jgi:small nuclear ribonucleoprotein (snRNP)-like protein
MGDKLEDACRNHKPVRLILSRGANVSGYIKSFDRQFAQAVIETENGECVIRLGYLIQIFVKNPCEESFTDYAKKHPHQKENGEANQ